MYGQQAGQRAAPGVSTVSSPVLHTNTVFLFPGPQPAALPQTLERGQARGGGGEGGEGGGGGGGGGGGEGGGGKNSISRMVFNSIPYLEPQYNQSSPNSLPSTNPLSPSAGH